MPKLLLGEGSASGCQAVSQEAFEAARTYRRNGKTGDLPEMLWRPWASEERFGKSVEAVASANDELKRMKSIASNPFSDSARAWLETRRDALIEAEGERVGVRLHRDLR